MNINRRKFIELSSALAGSSVLAASMPWLTVFEDADPAGRSASDRVRVGFIGVGSRGSTLLLNVHDFRDRLNVEIVAVCDDYPPHLERAIEYTGGRASGFLDYREMIDSVQMDAVIIATPLHMHTGPTIAAYEAGLHVFCEKSMARTLEDVRLMYDKHIEHNKILVIGHQRMFSPVYLTAMDRIRKGVYGPITMIKGHWHRNRDWVFYDATPGTEMDRRMNWRLYTDTSAGMITELLSHHLQVANWVMDAQPVSVTGSGSVSIRKSRQEVWDNFSVVFKYPDGTHFNYSCLQNNKHNGMQIQVLGNKGMADLEVNKQFWDDPPAPPAIRTLIHSIEKSLFETIPIGGATWVPAEPVSYGGEFISDNWQMNETQLLLEAFVEYVRKGSAPEQLAIEGYNASTWSLLAEQATFTGNKAELPEEFLL